MLCVGFSVCSKQPDFEKPHVHFKDGTALNQDGTVHDAHKGNLNLTNGTRNGWKGN